MWTAVAEVIPLAIAKLISPLSITAIIALLSAQRGCRIALAFVVGWLGCTLAVCAAMLAFVGDRRLFQRPVAPTLVGLVQLALGALFIAVAVRLWYRQSAAAPRTAAPELPGWMQKLDKVDIGRGFLLGAMLGAIGPKNLSLEFLAVATVHDARLSTLEMMVVLGIFALLGTLGVAAPPVTACWFSDRSIRAIGRWRSWLLANNNRLILGLPLAVGVYFVVKGSGELFG